MNARIAPSTLTWWFLLHVINSIRIVAAPGVAKYPYGNVWKCLFNHWGLFPVVSLYIITLKTSKAHAKSVQMICHKNTLLLVKNFRSFEKNIWCSSRDSWLLTQFSFCVSVNQARFVADPDSTVDLSHHLICSNLPDNSEFISSKLISHPRLQSLLLRSLAAAALRASTESEPHA